MSFSNLPDFTEGADKAGAFFLSLSGPELLEDERAFFKQANPFGFILFGRNCKNPAQLRALTDDLKELLGRECPILIDQEGGRVQRLQPPRWREYPPMRQFGEMAENDLDFGLADLRFTILQLAEELKDAGINVDCAPVCDLLREETHEVIGDRAFSSDPKIAGRLALSVCRNLLRTGVIPVIKHIPGHGRATKDSHHDLPVVETIRSELEKTDFEVFRQLAQSDVSDQLWAMTAHVIYSDIDADTPASLSSAVIKDVIRGQIGFDGLLMCDDVDMLALQDYGDIPERCLAAIKAGCDVALYCHADMKMMEEIASVIPNLSAKAQKTLQKMQKSQTLAA